MEISSQENITSAESLISTIKVDPNTYRWFTFLLSNKKVAAIFNNNAENKALYAKLRLAISTQQMLVLLSIVLITAIITTSKISLCLIFVILAIIDYFIEKNKRLYISKLAIILVLKDIGEKDFKDLTLYQICSRLAKEYSITSLIDKQFSYYNILRNFLIFLTLLLVTLVPNLSLFLPVLIPTFYVAIKILLKTNIIYKYL
ncbi:MAG: hypothetical protein KKF78_02525 [Candidatus Omnitrophica bacterium]|nr:hypothetical protein [Candidatus Omnitrophota bacterium]MBU1996013.1 hypothetical protein [Candidatus Omnitrophota bacterium]